QEEVTPQGPTAFGQGGSQLGPGVGRGRHVSTIFGTSHFVRLKGTSAHYDASGSGGPFHRRRGAGLAADRVRRHSSAARRTAASPAATGAARARAAGGGARVSAATPVGAGLPELPARVPERPQVLSRRRARAGGGGRRVAP